MTLLHTLNFLVAGFIGYIAGRWGDNHLNFWVKDPHWAPHHWTYGLLMVIVGIFCFKGGLGLWIFSFGLGLFVSDAKDFKDLKLWGSDGKEKHKVKFWHID